MQYAATTHAPAVTASVALPSQLTATVNQWPEWNTATSSATGRLRKVAAQDINGPSRAQLLDSVTNTGTQLAATATHAMEAMAAGMSYETLIEGFMTPGESISP